MEFPFIEGNMLIPALIFVAVLSLGGALITGFSAYRRDLRARLEGLAYTKGDDAGKKPISKMLTVLGGKFVSKNGESSNLRKELASAGFNGRGAVDVYLGAKMLLLIAFIFVFGGLALTLDADDTVKVLLGFGGPGLAFFLPNMIVKTLAEHRANEIRRHLPDAIDLLEICVSGGMGLDQAWNSVSDQLRPVCPLLADEMALTNLEIHLGGTRSDAMRHMAERTGSDDISSLVGVLVQSEKFGTSIGEALRVFTITMREQRSQRAEESAEKMSVKMLFPMIVMIFPVVLIVAVGPAIITINEVLG